MFQQKPRPITAPAALIVLPYHLCRLARVLAQFGRPNADVTVRQVQPEGEQGCLKWSCPVSEPSWTSATGIGGSEKMRALGRLLAIQEGKTPSPVPGEPVPVDPSIVTGPESP